MFTDEPTAAEAAPPTCEPLRAAALVVCRMDSRRLAGKVLRKVRGQTLLAWVLARLESATLLDRGVIVATTGRPVDDPIADFCRAHRVRCYRGATADVSGRVLACAEAHDLQWFARVNADSPFVDSRLLNQACRIAARGEHDLITNLAPRSFPYGVAVELVRVACFRRAYQAMVTAEHLEHVTKILYEQPGFCRRHNIDCPHGDLSDVRLTVDTADDWRVFAELADAAADRDGTISYQSAVRLRKAKRRAA